MQQSFELWQVTFQWLKKCGSKISQNYIKEELTTHPDYPALISVTDFLQEGDFNFKAVKADHSNVNEFNYPLLAHINEPGQERLEIINSTNEWGNDTNKYWSGIVLFPDLNSNWVNVKNSNYLKNDIIKRIALFLMISFGFSFIYFISFKVEKPLYYLIFGFTSIIGIIISLFLLSSELGYQSQVVKQVCGAGINSGCDKVLKSKYAKGFKGITPADTALIYFFVQYLMLILSGFFSQYFKVIIFYSFFGLLVSFISIYIQAIKIKNYCVLCLSIATLLIFQFLIGYNSFISFELKNITYSSVMSYVEVLLFLILSLTMIIFLVPIKNLIKENKRNKIKLAELKKWKLDSNLFINDWKQGQLVDVSEWENDLIIGEQNAPLLITVACSLYCVPCANMHKKLDEILLKHSKKLKIQLRLLCNPYDEKDIKTIAVKNILQKNLESQNNLLLKDMLNDWFKLMNLEKWCMKWGITENSNVLNNIEKHGQWVLNNSISHTPTIFLNGRKLPSRYTIEDFEQLIPQLFTVIEDL